jgi:hypothetical protein
MADRDELIKEWIHILKKIFLDKGRDKKMKISNVEQLEVNIVNTLNL